MKRISKRRSPSDCRALVLTDSSRARRKALSDCQRARATFEKAKTELEIFETRDKSEFTRWYRAEFGPMIEQMKSLLDQTAELRERMMRLQRFADLKRCSASAAAALFERSIDEFTRLEEVLIAEARRQEERIRQQYKREALQDMARFMKTNQALIRRLLKRGDRKSDVMFEMLSIMEMEFGVPHEVMLEVLRDPAGEQVLKSFGLDGALDEPWDSDDREEEHFLFDEDDELPFDLPPPGAPARPSSGVHEARIKSLFRELAFALHPDQSTAGSDPANLALWHQVQDAMNARDLDRLEVLHGHVQLQRGELSPQASISRLMDLTRMYRNSREALRRKIRALRQEHEWGFASADNDRRRALHAVVKSKLSDELRQARSEHHMIQSLYHESFTSRSSPLRARKYTAGA